MAKPDAYVLEPVNVGAHAQPVNDYLHVPSREATLAVYDGSPERTSEFIRRASDEAYFDYYAPDALA